MADITALNEYLKEFPFVAITRGIRPDEAVELCSIIRSCGFRIIENPLNSPNPYQTIEKLAAEFGDSTLIGAGTVTDPEQVKKVKDAGGEIIISPNSDQEVIQATREAGLLSLPGVATPSEAFAALKWGADALKLFPAEMLGPKVVKALLAVIPKTTPLLPVGSIVPGNWQPYLAAGAAGFGLGSSLYKAGISRDDLLRNGQLFAESWRQYHTQGQPV